MLADTRMLLVLAAVVSCGIPRGLHAATPNSVDAKPPTLLVKASSGEWRSYEWAADGDGGWRDGDDDLAEASATLMEGDRWVVKLTAKADLAEVWFPWRSQRSVLGDSIDDDVVYQAFSLGVARMARTQGEWAWWGVDYPGPAFSPLVVVADKKRARMVAAANWPPRRVCPMASLGREVLRYPDLHPSGEMREYSAIVAEYTGDEDNGAVPWHLALDRYRAWLHAQMARDGLYPIGYSGSIKGVDGWLNIQLENLPRFEPHELHRRIERWAGLFGWVQFWGQMSNYSGPKHLATPPLEPDENTGCCLDKRDIHPRYGDELARAAERTKQKGARVGFYCRPRDPNLGQHLDDGTLVNGETNLAFLVEWIRRLGTDLGADAFYIDTLGCLDYGPPLGVAKLFGDAFPCDTVIEGVVDVYPCAFLISGFIGGNDWGGGPSHRRERLGSGVDKMLFPAFGRYLLRDRIMFCGQSNNDWKLWGSKNSNWVERQAFLLGAKLDVIHPSENGVGSVGALSPVLERIIGERRRVGWWALDPQYLDTQGVSGVPAGVDVRRFRASDGRDLLVIDNPRRLRGKWFKVDGVEVGLPDASLSIQEVAKGRAVGAAGVGGK